MHIIVDFFFICLVQLGRMCGLNIIQLGEKRDAQNAKVRIKTSLADTCLYSGKHAIPNVGQDNVSKGVSSLYWHATLFAIK